RGTRAVVPSARPPPRRLEVSSAGADRSLCGRFCLRGCSRDRGARWRAARGADRTGQGKNRGPGSHGLSRAALLGQRRVVKHGWCRGADFEDAPPTSARPPSPQPSPLRGEGADRVTCMSESTPKLSPVEAELRQLAASRILVLDGAMGTMIQGLGLDEEGYRGARFDAWNREGRGNNALLNLSRPGAVRDLHLPHSR